jgi:stage V sporulation protein D (sporulation-specific penicillin-binding protein)
VANEATREVSKLKPVKVRRVVRKATARTMMEFCRRAVVDGTGELAAIDLMDVSGKTGTAQKASPRGGYLPGRYVSSFIGFAPHDDPRVVCLVLLDEPQYKSRYGGVSSAPVFAGLCHEVANATGVFDGRLTSLTIPCPADLDDDYEAPNFIRMERAAALEWARKLGCNVLCQGEEGRVVAQIPAPGLPMDKDGVIRLVVTVSSKPRKSRVTTPDLRGLPVRKAKAVAAQHGLKCTLVGSGVVKSQSPGPGRETGHKLVTLYCGTVGGAGGGRGGGGSR